tara:strand:- start:1005 stop:3047 length:2043 start_codon:yes stop_codon:yes gene_type:complete
MITNKQPVRLAFQASTLGYTKGVFYHSSYSDQDVEGKAIWIDSVLQPVDTNLDYLYFSTVGMTPNTSYSFEAAFYDAMVDVSMLEARTMVSISEPLSVTTAKEPTITGYSIEADPVDVGVSPPIVVLDVEGDADSVEIQYAPAGTTEWASVYIGPIDSAIRVSNIPVGTVDIRMQGRISLTDVDSTIDKSAWSTITNVEVDWVYAPPSAPTNVGFTVALLAEPTERYDVLVSWDWEQSGGASLREFVVYSIPQSLYDSNPSNNKWEGATLINTGVSKNAVIINHPYKTEVRYRVAAVSWGPVNSNSQFSAETTLTIDENTDIDNDFTTQTGIEMTYAHIKGLLNDEGTWKQTFLIDAATGAVSIGLLDQYGEAPISFDPVGGNVNVKGGVVSETITAASYVLANLSGTDSPSFRSAAKSEYGDASDGIWMGHDSDGGYDFKFDLGNDTQYIRWDGGVLRISGDVVIGTPDGDVPIQNGSAFTAFIYKLDTSPPDTSGLGPEFPPAGWSDVPPIRTVGTNVYVATGLVSRATGELVAGESWSTSSQFTGTEGTRGPSFYTEAITGFTSFNTTAANNFFIDLYGAEGAPVQYDVMTQYNPSNPSVLETREWNGSAWVGSTLAINGNVIVDGSIRAESIVATDAFFQEVGANYIYDNAAFNNGNPAADYSMRISLIDGSIHIR